MTVPNDTVENENRVTDNIQVSVVDRDEGVFEARNESHDNPDEHEYKVFTEDEEAFHCTCPAFEHNSGLDDEGRCKHMRVVEQFCCQLHFRDWQNVQKEREEEARKQAMQEAKQRVFADGGDVGDDDGLTEEEKELLELGAIEIPEPFGTAKTERMMDAVQAALQDDTDVIVFDEEYDGDLPDFDEYMEQQREQDDDEDEKSEKAEQVIESAEKAVEAYESVEEQAEETAQEQLSKEEWREMSSKGRRRAVAFF